MNNLKKNLKQQNTAFTIKKWGNKIFHFDTKEAIIKKEIIGGISTFIGMAYILAVNPSLVGQSPVTDNPNVSFASSDSGGLFLATAISSFLATFLMGLFANVPIALAPGMGLNAFFAFTVAPDVGFSSALTITIISGLFYFLIVITPLRSKINKLIPNNVKLAIGVAIGFFIAYLGLQNSGIIVQGSGTVTSLGDFTNPLVILALVMILVTLGLHYLKVPGSILISLLIGAIILLSLIATGHIHNVKINDMLGSYNDFGTFKEVVTSGWLGFANVEMWKSPMTYIAILSFLYMDFFDTTGTLIMLSKMTKFDKHSKKWMNRANMVDAISTIGGAGIGSTTVTCFVESSIGISAGAKTGLANIITACLFGLSIAAWPILQIFMPVNGLQPITSPILILIGTLMIMQIKRFNWKMTIDIPMLFVTIIFMMLSNSIADGIGFGVTTFVFLNFLMGLVEQIKGVYALKNVKKSPEDSQTYEKKKNIFWSRINWILLFISVFFITFIIINIFI